MNYQANQAKSIQYSLRNFKRIFFSLCFLFVVCVSAATPAFAVSTVSNQNVIGGGNDQVSYAIMSDGTLWIWGRAGYSTSRPKAVMSDVRSVYGEDTFCAVIKNDNSLWFADVDNYSQEEIVFKEPVKIADDVWSYEGAWNSYIKNDHTLWYAEQNNGKWQSIYVDNDVVSATGVSLGFYGGGFAVVKSDGSLWMWGRGDYGDGSGPFGHEDNYRTHVKVMDDVTWVSGDGYGLAVIKKDHSLWAWGTNEYRQIWNVDADYVYYPTKIMDNVLAASLGTTCAVIKMDGSLWLWGRNIDYKVGNGIGRNDGKYEPVIIQSTPTKILDGVVEVFSNAYTLAVKSDGSLWAWGRNFNFFGDDSIGDTPYPPDTGLSPWKFQSVPIKIRDGAMVPIEMLSAISVHVNVNGENIVWTDAVPFVDANSRTMVPLRAVGDALGLTVDWNGDTREAVFSNGTKTLYFPIDSKTAHSSDGQTIQMDTAAVAINGRTYAPVRYLAEYFGFTVDWDGSARTVLIT